MTGVNYTFLHLYLQAFRLVWLRSNYRFNCIEVDYSDTDLAKEVI